MSIADRRIKFVDHDDQKADKGQVQTDVVRFKIVGFLCNWCGYAGADLAGSLRRDYPADIRIIRVPCSGRVNPLLVAKALLDGADGVMVSG